MATTILLAGEAREAARWQAAAERAGLHVAVAEQLAEPEGLVAAALEAGARGIFPASTEAVIPCAAAAQKLRMPGPAPEWFLRDAAISLREAWTSQKLPLLPYRVAATMGDAQAALTELGTPVWVRESDLFDGAVRFRVDAEGELALGVRKAQHGSPERPVVLEAPAAGHWVRVLGLKCGRDFRPIEVIDDYYDNAPYRVPNSLLAPAMLNDYTYKNVITLARKAAGSLPPGYGLLAVECVVGSEALHLSGLEVYSTLSPIVAALLKQAFAIDLEAAWLRLAAGLPVDLSSARYHATAAGWLTGGSGVFREISGLEAARALPGVCAIEVVAQPGDVLGHIVDQRSRGAVGYIVVSGPTKERACLALDAARATCSVIVEPIAG